MNKLHVAIIPDGNRRWAQERNKEPGEGHWEGAKRVEEIIQVCQKTEVQYLSFWGSSLENLEKRSFAEKKELFKIYQNYFLRLLNSKEIYKNKTRINFFGDWEKRFPQKLKKTMQKIRANTKEYHNYWINFFLAYSGEKEIIDAISEIARKYKKGLIKKITPRIMKAHLLTKELPAVDFLIRTGLEGDPHLSSGFMMWELQNSQLFFTKKKWPEFRKYDFIKAIADYRKRKRRLGK